MIYLVSRLAYLVIKILQLTCRYQCIHPKPTNKNHTNNSPVFIIGIWHQNLLSFLISTKVPYILMVSKNKDGSIISYTLKKNGHFITRGSSKKNGKEKGGQVAKNQMIEMLKQNKHSACLTVDGPTGPPWQVKPGIIDLAKKSGFPVIAATSIPQKYWSINSWDKLRIPKPFTKIINYYGEPLYIPKDISNDDFEKMKEQYQLELTRIENKTLEFIKNM